jgi:hypothetical protein
MALRETFNSKENYVYIHVYPPERRTEYLMNSSNHTIYEHSDISNLISDETEKGLNSRHAWYL